MDHREQLIDELARCIAAVARGDGHEALSLVQSAHDRLANRKQQALPGVADADPAGQDATDGKVAALAAARRLIAYWQQQCSHPSAKATPERLAKLGARLRDGYTEAEIRKAIDGAAAAAFTNDDGHKFDDLTLICRNGSKLEDFIARGEKATGAIVVEASATGGTVEERIWALRRSMSVMHRDGRATEYAQATEELHRLMAQRGAS